MPIGRLDFSANPRGTPDLCLQGTEQSKVMSSNKAEDIMDVTPEEVRRLLQEMDQSILVHGHTHRPAEHNLDIHGKPGKRIVLGDWHTLG